MIDTVMRRANFSLQRTAGLRFSQLVAQLPAAAEFRCWSHGIAIWG